MGDHQPAEQVVSMGDHQPAKVCARCLAVLLLRLLSRYGLDDVPLSLLPTVEPQKGPVQLLTLV